MIELSMNHIIIALPPVTIIASACIMYNYNSFPLFFVCLPVKTFTLLVLIKLLNGRRRRGGGEVGEVEGRRGREGKDGEEK